MTEDLLALKPLSMDDVHKLIGALYLEIDMLRRQNLALRAHLEEKLRRVPDGVSDQGSKG